jgi:DNA-binding response OmpR family regulator
MPEGRLLVVDDEDSQRTVLAGFLKKRGFAVLTAASADEALKAARTGSIDLVLTDLRMPGMSGVDLLKELRRLNPELQVIVMTAFGTVASAVDAMKHGASDCLTKPVDLDELEMLVARNLERRALESENRERRRQLESRYGLQGLETASASMASAINTAARAAASRATVLIRGESGTGKELLARAIHHASPRARRPFIAVNIAALPETLIESELFGHERGAFTGPDREVRGRFELADGGTLLLDEVGDLPRATQVKLLRVLQEQAIERLGGTRTVQLDVRVDREQDQHGEPDDDEERPEIPDLRQLAESGREEERCQLDRHAEAERGVPRVRHREGRPHHEGDAKQTHAQSGEGSQDAMAAERCHGARDPDPGAHAGHARQEDAGIEYRRVGRLGGAEFTGVLRDVAIAGEEQRAQQQSREVQERHADRRPQKHPGCLRHVSS